MIKPGTVNLGDIVISKNNDCGYAIITKIAKYSVTGEFNYRSSYIGQKAPEDLFLPGRTDSLSRWQVNYNDPNFFIASELDKALYL
jgi:hypothetical protein